MFSVFFPVWCIHESELVKIYFSNAITFLKYQNFFYQPCEREAVVFDSNEERSSKTIPQGKK